MTTLMCNNCGTSQKAKVFEAYPPFELLINPEYSRFFLLVIEKCKKCSQKKIVRVVLTYAGSYEVFGFLKKKYFAGVLADVFAELEDGLPEVEKIQYKKGFYLLYSEHGIEKRCYSNLSSMKLGIDKNLGVNYGKSAKIL